jgi:hypothetical protein
MTKQIDLKRRALLGGLTTAGTLAAGGAPALAAPVAVADPWQRALEIERRFSSPQRFRDQDFEITDFGAKPCTVAAVRAYISAHEKGETMSPVRGSHHCYPAITARRAMARSPGSLTTSRVWSSRT